MRFKLNKNQEKIRYTLCPQRKIYDKIDSEWLPNIMFFHKKKFKSEVCNTDIHGLRFNSKEESSLKESIFDFSKKNNNLLVGSSTVFGIGSSNDKNTICSLLCENDDYFFNISGRAFNMLQEIILFFSISNKIKNIKNIVVLSGLNDTFLFANNKIRKNFPGPIYWNNQFSNTMNNLSKNFKTKFKDYFYTFSQKSNENRLNVDLNEVIGRNFNIWNTIGKGLNCKVYFFLQPYLFWSKDHSVEEKMISEYTNTRSDKIVYDNVNKSYDSVREVFKKACFENNITFFDTNEHFKNNYTKNDWLFIDNVHLNDNGNLAIKKFIKENIIL